MKFNVRIYKSENVFEQEIGNFEIEAKNYFDALPIAEQYKKDHEIQGEIEVDFPEDTEGLKQAFDAIKFN